ncbi:ABC-F family ATP-binding cassette domain-containing protein [Dyadobacter sp. Leaf189]|uniref:ABC-F family ATP-binding cassette domain-containing protein n=1 Tax=Dyadobacter sp. Leaf189 TaxID=1736295 RepID=UPI0006FDF2E0|nr:ABC-F family ATP-binding cassette domain-containing protein [Dyadobacter sp. Leaf189]KQS28279.1 ABC transporter ATP-binding protein [Dyadobacter sp. Leaf189]
MLFIQDVAYAHPNRDMLFQDINLTIHPHEKAALIGNNGAGKSTLIKILAGQILPQYGHVKYDSQPYYIPQLFDQLNDQSIEKALGIDEKVNALNQILNGNVTEENLTLLGDDWTIEERCREAFELWKLPDFNLSQKLGELSGGQKTKVLLAGIRIHNPDIILLDEPSNHLDAAGRKLLYDFVQMHTETMLIASHDRMLLSLAETIYELTKKGITTYGGNFDFYQQQKAIEQEALAQDLKSREKALRKAKEIEKETLERQQKLDARGKKKQEKAGLPTIMMNTLKNNAEKSTSKIKGIHSEKVGAISQELSALRRDLPGIDKMKMNLDHSALHRGKLLVNANQINFRFDQEPIWKSSINLQITSGERIALKGNNGSGKTTLIKLILGQLTAQTGKVERADFKSIYIDQEYSLIKNELSVFDQVQQFNDGFLQEHEVKIRLNRFLFTREFWDKPCGALSGGEKMRLMLCSVSIISQSPDMIILDEPTNNLDLQNLEILTAAMNEYQGTILVVSHDEHFLEQIKIERVIQL